MVEMILAGLIVGAVVIAAAVTGIRDWRRRRADRRGSETSDLTFGEPIPSGWMAAGSPQGPSGAGFGGGCGGGDGGC